MIDAKDFLRNNVPAHGETEHQYFSRMAYEFDKVNKAEARKMRQKRVIGYAKRLFGKSE